MRRLFLLLVVLAPLGGCAAAQAKTPVERPNLEVPPPPPRVIEPVIPSEPPVPEPVAELPAPPATPRPRPAQRDTGKQDPPPKTELPPVEQPPATPPTAAAAPPPPQLRMPNTPDSAQAERQVRDIISRAFATLQSIDYGKLRPEQRAQYDNAKLMLSQAEEGIKAANFEIARNLAEKAERIAKELQGR